MPITPRSVNRPFDSLALLGDILLAFGDVSVGLD
jgi:hypothetical protein